MENPVFSWTLLLVVWGVALFREGYVRGRRAGLAAWRPVPSPPIEIRVPDPTPPPTGSPLAPANATRVVRIGGRAIVVDASALTET